MVANLLWVQAAGCGGETASLLNSDRPHLLAALRALDVTVLGHTYLQDQPTRDIDQVLAGCLAGRVAVDLLVVEGATYQPAPRALPRESDHPSMENIRAIARLATHVVAVGTCACFGGVVACGRNPLGAVGLQHSRDEKGGLLEPDYRSRGGLPVVNVPGCPAHPDWMIGTLWALRANRIAQADLDLFNRPRVFYGKLAHHACPRNEYYEFKASAASFSHQGCLFENLGCKGTLCESDCNERLWLARTGSCTRGGFPCLSCTSPLFPDGFVPFFETAKIGGIPTSLPLDVPKAWYVGISGLSKLACPERLRRNAVSFKPAWSEDEEPD
ncbi:MAG: HupU protein [Candidatus Riflebacteria bacterium]|nr:HupU protein [Candidatus Riflebacteria bacterium]